MTRFFTEKEVLELLPMSAALLAVEEAFRLLGGGETEAVNHPRTRVRAGKLMLHVMPAGSAAIGYLGLKAYTTGPSGARFYVMLFDASTGELAALLEADRLGQIRTGAASGVATRHLAREDARRVGIYGTGWQARSQLEAMALVRSLESVVAYGRDEERRQRFAAEMSAALGIEVTAIDSPEAVPKGADIVITATSAKEPVLMGDWLEPGQHVNAIGGNHARRREIDDTVVERAAIVAIDSIEQAKIECGDLLPLIESGKRRWSDFHELADVVAGKTEAKRGTDDVTLFESQGIALEDVAVAKHILETGRERGMGRELGI